MRRNAFPMARPPSKDLTVGGAPLPEAPVTVDVPASARDGAQAFLRNKAIFQGAFTRSSHPPDRLKAGLRTRGLRRLKCYLEFAFGRHPTQVLLPPRRAW